MKSLKDQVAELMEAGYRNDTAQAKVAHRKWGQAPARVVVSARRWLFSAT